MTTVRGKSGTERKEETLFIDCTVWERQAETCSEYLTKGRPVLVEGRLIEDSWQDKETGERRSRIKVYVQNVQFLGSRDGGQGTSGRYDAASSGRFEAGAASDDRSGSRRVQPKSEPRPGPAKGPADPFGEASASRGSGPAGDDIPF